MDFSGDAESLFPPGISKTDIWGDAETSSFCSAQLCDDSWGNLKTIARVTPTLFVKSGFEGMLVFPGISTTDVWGDAEKPMFVAFGFQMNPSFFRRLGGGPRQAGRRKIRILASNFPGVWHPPFFRRIGSSLRIFRAGANRAFLGARASLQAHPFCGLFPPCWPPPPLFFRRLGGSLRIFRAGGGRGRGIAHFWRP